MEKNQILLIGNESVGKTSIAKRLKKKTFDDCEPATVGVDFYFYDVYYEDSKINFQIVNPSCHDRDDPNSGVRSHCRDASGAILVFDVNKRKSFEDLENWITLFKEVARPNAPIVIAANKIDKCKTNSLICTNTNNDNNNGFGYNNSIKINGFGDNHKEINDNVTKNIIIARKVVRLEEAKEFAELNGCKLFPTSAKTGQNVENLFKSVVKDILSNTITVDKTKPKVEKGLASLFKSPSPVKKRIPLISDDDILFNGAVKEKEIKSNSDCKKISENVENSEGINEFDDREIDDENEEEEEVHHSSLFSVFKLSPRNSSAEKDMELMNLD